MGRTIKGSNTPNVTPVQRIELSEKHLGIRIFLVVVLLAVGAGAFAYGINALFSSENGWQEIKADTRSGVANCSEEFVFMYNLGASGASATAEAKAITTLYTDATEKAYQLFHTKEAFENVNNIFYINQHPNEEILVDEMLYHAFEQISQYKNRNIYMGPVYMQYDDIFYCTDDHQLVDFDPYMNPDIAEDYREIAAFANDPDMIDIQILGDNKIKLYVSDEYLKYAEENFIYDYIDFFWMKNAFIVDYIADILVESGYTRGSISSYDGFIRNLDKTETLYSFNVYDRVGQHVRFVKIMDYTGPKSLVYLRDYTMNELDYHHYYELDNGEIRTAYVDVKDGLCKNSLDNLYSYSADADCVEVLMQMIPIYIADEFDEESLLNLDERGIYSIYFKENELYYNDETLILNDI